MRKEDFVINLGLDEKDVVAGLNKITGGFSRLQKVMGIAIGAKAIHEMARYGHEISNLAAQTGMSVKNMTNLRNAFVSAGSSAGSFDSMINSINSGLIGLSIGDTRWAARLSTLGISPYNETGIKSPEQVLGDIADWAKNQRDLGRSEREVAGLLMQLGFATDFQSARELMKGRGGLAADKKRSEERIGSLTDKEVKDLEYLNKQLRDLGAAAKETGARLVADIAEPVGKVVDWTREGVKYLHDNKEARWTATIGSMFISSGVLGWTLKKLGLTKSGNVVGGIWNATSWLGKKGMGGIENLFRKGILHQTKYDYGWDYETEALAKRGANIKGMVGVGIPSIALGADLIHSGFTGEQTFIEKGVDKMMEFFGLKRGWANEKLKGENEFLLQILKDIDWFLNSGEVFDTAVNKFNDVLDWFLDKLGLNDEQEDNKPGVLNTSHAIPERLTSPWEINEEGDIVLSDLDLPDLTKTKEGYYNNSVSSNTDNSNNTTITINGNVTPPEAVETIAQAAGGVVNNQQIALLMSP